MRIVDNKVIDTGYKKSYTISLPMGEVCICMGVVGIVLLSSNSTGILVIKLVSHAQYDTFVYAVNNANRTVTITEQNGGNIRLIIVSA